MTNEDWHQKYVDLRYDNSVLQREKENLQRMLDNQRELANDVKEMLFNITMLVVVIGGLILWQVTAKPGWLHNLSLIWAINGAVIWVSTLYVVPFLKRMEKRWDDFRRDRAGKKRLKQGQLL